MPHEGVQAVVEAGLVDREALLRAVLDRMSPGVVVADVPTGSVVMINDAALHILGQRCVPEGSDVFEAIDGLCHADGRPYEPDEHPLFRALSGDVVDVGAHYRRPNGALARLALCAAPLHDAGGRMVAVTVTLEDVTEQHAVEERLRWRLRRLVRERTAELSEHDEELARVNGELRTLSDGLEETVRQRTTALVRQAQHDHLTGLPNRVLLEERLERSVETARRHGRRLALLFLDLDGFKLVNDTFGHDVGDDVLQQIGGRLASCLRSSDTLARFGGDEFVALISDVRRASDVDDVARALLTCVAEPCRVLGQPITLTASLGVSVFPDDAADASALQRHADMAMYRSKQAGKNRVTFHDSD